MLSDPQKRKEHDFWIAEKESTHAKENVPRENSNPVKPEQTKSDSAYLIKVILHLARNWILYGIAVIVILYNFDITQTSPKPTSKPYSSNPTPEIEPTSNNPFAEFDAKYSKDVPAKSSDSSAQLPAIDLVPAQPVDDLTFAPNGEAWPTVASYVKGYKRLSTKGLSSVTVDNSQNDSNVFVKLVSLSGAKAYPIRQFFIPAYGKFTVNKVTSGDYDVRYRDLSSGGLSRSESFNLVETQTNKGTQFSNITMTLYKVQNGNMHTYGLSEAEF
ncbi:MAG: J domain-containing protein [Methylophilaceae bacterium]|nr:J domain-containing protein [Methylophilaceae bacterium]